MNTENEQEKLYIEKALEIKYKDINIEEVLNETVNELKNGNIKYLTHEQVFENARRIVNKTAK